MPNHTCKNAPSFRFHVLCWEFQSQPRAAMLWHPSCWKAAEQVRHCWNCNLWKYLWIHGNTALHEWIFGNHCQSRIVQLLLVPALLTNVWCLHMLAICWVHLITLMSTETSKLASKHRKTAFCTLFHSQSSGILKSILLKSLWLHNSFRHGKVDPQRMHHMETSTIKHIQYCKRLLAFKGWRPGVHGTSENTVFHRRSKELGAPAGRDFQPQKWPRAKLCRAHRDECSCEWSVLLVCRRLYYDTC